MRVSRDLDWGATSTIGDAVTYAVLVRLRKPPVQFAHH